MATKTIFHPYKVIAQADNHLELGSNAKATIWLLRLVPLLVPAIFAFFILTSEEPMPIEIFYVGIGVTLFCYLLIAFFKIPASVKIDTIGMTVLYVTLFGYKEKHMLWSQVDRVEHVYRRGKGGGYYTYRVITNDRKKINFLTFSGYHLLENNFTQVNKTIQQLSGRPVSGK